MFSTNCFDGGLECEVLVIVWHILSDEIDETEDDYFVVNETEHIGNKCKNKTSESINSTICFWLCNRILFRVSGLKSVMQAA